MDSIRLNDKGLLNSYKFTSKIHSKMSKNILYHFVLNIFAHYTFEQRQFKKNFVNMDPVSRKYSQDL